MSPTFKEQVFDLSDLKLFSVVCGKCQCEMIADLSDSSTDAPSICSCCRQLFNPIFKEHLDHFRTAYKQLAAKPDGFSVRVRVRSEVGGTEL
jgi:hypothetical protein